MVVYAPAQIITAPAQLITAPAQLITAPAQPPATGAVVYTALFIFISIGRGVPSCQSSLRRPEPRRRRRWRRRGRLR